ncbi:hypothetical protein MKZ20_12210 [Psychrobacillus sp. FSL K6-2684]|uniref:Aminoglycoside phosphotransferase domain-containing protein n=1 Tax=Psychrobacillus faecigallinarum TaxID=2762235 RepID=A0ABR8R7K1_9BACI|nr:MULTISPECIES: hypothetical protein [Psychrobacillus]MBD7943759.1 hypothetical protein [Psychrobacillus faecigallinarum]QEY19276.1 hypothetical protein D0S48_00370 [Psychrobacillus sp. AK 1817]
MDTYIKQIKKNVWKWKNEDGIFSVKKYTSGEQAAKIRYIHDELYRLEKPFVLPIIPSTQQDYIIQPWFKNNRTVSYKDKKDRSETYSLLKRMHSTRKKIEWEKSNLLYPFNLISKWQTRFLKVDEIAPFIESYIGFNKTKLLVQYGDMALQNIRPFSMKNPTLLHGDVVHHNFLANDFTYKIIDFDLAVLGPRETEYILWIHRVLPEMEYDIELFLNEFPELEKTVAKYKEAIMYPNELYREWLYAFALPGERKQKFINQLIPYTNKALTNWPSLCYNLSQL